MRKKVLGISVGIVLVMILGIGTSIFWWKHMSYSAQIAELVNISELENVVFKIYKTNDFDSSVIALNYLSDKLKFYKETSDPKSRNYGTFITDLGLTHARLFLVYEAKGKQDLAEQEYQKAIELLGGKFKIGSRKELKKMIEKMDKSAQNIR